MQGVGVELLFSPFGRIRPEMSGRGFELRSPTYGRSCVLVPLLFGQLPFLVTFSVGMVESILVWSTPGL